MKMLRNVLSFLLFMLMFSFAVMAADIPSEATLIKNVKIFDGDL